MSLSEFSKEFNVVHIQVRKEKTGIKKIINYWLDTISNSNHSENDKTKKEKELIDLGAFLHFYDNKIEILDGNRECPDFILKTGKRKIGIELTDLIIDKYAKKTEGTIHKIFSKVLNRINLLEIDYRGFYGVKFKNNITFRSNSDQIVQEIINIITKKSNESEFIKFINRRPHSKFVLHNIQGGAFGILEKKTCRFYY